MIKLNINKNLLIKTSTKEDKTKSTKEDKTKLTKGKLCSINGNNYEKEIYNIIINYNINGQKFNTQDIKELGGSKIVNDIQCNYIKEKNIGIEIKKFNSPDWVQCSIIYNYDKIQWETSKKSKLPIECQDIFNIFINKIKLFDNDIPPFMKKKITHEEWINIKKNTKKWNDVYINIPNDIIKKLYYSKKCQYIQISNGYGLFHLGNDICNFNVPEFIIDQQIRIRTKIHNKKNAQGFCNISVTIACQPKNIKLLKKSPYTLDNKDKLPKNLILQH